MRVAPADFCTSADAGRVALGLVVLWGGALAGCLEQGAPPPARPRTCVSSRDCRAGEVCSGGVCGALPGDVAVDQDPQPVVRLLTDALRFADVGRGRTATRSLRIANLGGANLEISRVDVPGAGGRVAVTPDPAGFVLLIPPQGEFGLTVRFTGSDGAPFVALLTLTTNDPAALHVSVPLLVDYTGRPEVIVTETMLGQHGEDLDGQVVDLGPVPAGRGLRHALYLKNLGVGGMFAVFDPPALVGDDGFALSVMTPSDEDGRHRLGRFAAFCAVDEDCGVAAASCVERVCTADGRPVDLVAVQVDVDLAVGVVGTAELRVPYGAASGSFAGEARVTLQARGAPPDLYLEPAAVEFESVSVGFPSSRLVRLFNFAEVPLTLDAVAVTGAAATPPALIIATPLDFTLPVELAPSSVGLIRVDFIANVERLGPTSGTLAVTVSERPGVDYGVPLTGRARIGPLLVTEPLLELALGPVHVGQPALGAIWLHNLAAAGADPLLVLDAWVSDQQGGQLGVDLPLPAPVPAGSAAPLVVRCAPAARGASAGRLTVVTDAPDNPVRSFLVGCVGVDPQLSLTYASRDQAVVREWSLDDEHACRDDVSFPSPCMDFGAIYASRSVTLPVRLTNGGADPLRIVNLSVEPAGPFSLPALDVPFVLTPGQAFGLELGYAASATPATELGALLIEHDDADRPPVFLRLVGSTTTCEPGLRDCSASSACQAENTVSACCPSLDDPEACLSCAPCPAKSHTAQSCVSDACVYQCVPGWHDLDGDGSGLGGPIENGCEYPCVVTQGGVEGCDRIDNDCDGVIDEQLPLGDGGGEAPAECAPGGAGFLGNFSEGDLGQVVAGVGELLPIVSATGRIYVPVGSPAGDVDWLRVGFTEGDACTAVGFRVAIRLTAPQGTALELCAALFDPLGQPPTSAACTVAPPFAGCASSGVGGVAQVELDWPEMCGVADDRVIDLRVRAEPLTPEHYSCETYQVEVSGAAIY